MTDYPMARSQTYRLPWPPSVNTYWRKGPKVTYLSPKAKAFREDVLDALAGEEWEVPCFSRLGVHIELTLPDRRKRDIDNHIKAVLDALQHAGVFEDDEQVDELRVKRLHVEPPGCCDVTIVELESNA